MCSSKIYNDQDSVMLWKNRQTSKQEWRTQKQTHLVPDMEGGVTEQMWKGMDFSINESDIVYTLQYKILSNKISSKYIVALNVTAKDNSFQNRNKQITACGVSSPASRECNRHHKWSQRLKYLFTSPLQKKLANLCSQRLIRRISPLSCGREKNS